MARKSIKKIQERLIYLPAASGSYIIVSVLKQPLKMIFNPLWLGWFIPSGYYFYCGSAHGYGGLKARVQHHLKRKTRKHWHFDLLKDYLDLVEIWWDAAEGNNECIFSKTLQKHSLSNIPLPGFGSSDCTHGCGSHLVYFPTDISLNDIYNFMQDSKYGLERMFLLPGL